MKIRIYYLLFFLLLFKSAYGFEIEGNLNSWKKEDFLGFDQIGDSKGNTGDIASAFMKLKSKKLYLRITFADMVKRKNNRVIKDNFQDKNIKLILELYNSKDKNLFRNTININKKEAKKNTYYILRTPTNNLLEISITSNTKLKREDLYLNFVITYNDKIIDEYSTYGGKEFRGGNCAFAHHGNQGLTYTEVFYGQYPIETSGYDEVLEVHEATNIPGNFHMSGTLMPAAEWHSPGFNDWLETGVTNGWVAMLTSALGQHIMPFVQNDMNNWSVDIECDMVDFFYNYIPKVAWIPERVWLAPGYYPDSGVIDWLGDNWTQHGVNAVILDDWPHCSGANNKKIHWMNNGSGVILRVIPIDNEFVGKMHYDAEGAKNHINGTGEYGITIYGTDWEAVAEMNEHHNTMFLDNYENVLWYCHDNYPAINVWKLDSALDNSNFNGQGIDIQKGTYGLLGGTDGYGGSNNIWYSNWAGCESHSDFHEPKWNYGYIWNDAYNNLISAPNNSIAQLGWYTMMINLHETGWHSNGEIADWEHRYSSHIKNANVYAEVSRWANGEYTLTTAAYFSDIDHDGGDELIIHNNKVFFVIEGIGGKANWIFYKDDYGNAYSVVGSDVAYYAETDGDYNENSYNHFAALSDVYPNQQHSVYDITINSSGNDSIQATLTQWGVSKTFTLSSGKNYMDVIYNFYDQTGYVKSGWSVDLLDLIWSGKSHLQRMWGDYGSYCGQRNLSSGATVALILGNGGANHNCEFEGTLVKGDEIKGYNNFKIRLFAGYTSQPYDPYNNKVTELDSLASENMDIFPPHLNEQAFLVSDNTVQITFDEAIEEITAEDISNYSLNNFGNSYTLNLAERQSDWTKINLTINEVFQPGDSGIILVSNLMDLNNNEISSDNFALLAVPSGMTPHVINIDGNNDFDEETELIESQIHSLDITWDDNNLYIGFYNMDLNGEGDLFVNIDTDQLENSGATSGSWGRVDFSNPYLPEYQIAIEGGGGSMQVNNWTSKGWNYPGNGAIGSAYEGWTENEFTEISIPWSAMGNPSKIALSAHISEEDNHIIPEIFPSLNQTGDHPLIEYIYSLFTPYITSEMPLSGMEPKNVFIVPNSSPEISFFLPDSQEITMEEMDTVTFSVTVDDFENDELYYTWRLDGIISGSQSYYNYLTDYNSQGLHTLIVSVSDNVPVNSVDSLSWLITVNDFILNTPEVTITLDNNDIILNWNYIEEANGYKVYASELPYTGFTLIDTTLTNSYTDLNTALETKKFYKISAYMTIVK